MCEFRVPFVLPLPKGFPQVGPWHHVGTTMEITLEKNWIIEVIRWELNPVNVQSNKIIDPR
jgi:hypothetical protein